MIVQAIDMARYYAFNSLHNLVQLQKTKCPGTRLDTVLKQFFDVGLVDKSTARKNQTGRRSHLYRAGRSR